MCNVAIKQLAVSMGCALICVSMLGACGDSEKEKAGNLYGEASGYYENGQYKEALQLLDSIDSAYPGQVDIRREAMHLRPMIIEKQTLAELSETDSLIAIAKLRSDSLGHNIVFVENPVEGYYVSAEQKGKDVASAPGIYPRMTPDGQFYIIASNNRPIKSTSISIALADGTEARTVVIPFDGERNDRMGGCEVITFMQAECDTIGALASKNPSGSYTLTFHGQKSVSMPLVSAQLQSLVNVYGASSTVKELKVLQLRKTHLERQLALARSQMARTFNEGKETE